MCLASGGLSEAAKSVRLPESERVRAGASPTSLARPFKHAASGGETPRVRSIECSEWFSLSDDSRAADRARL